MSQREYLSDQEKINKYNISQEDNYYIGYRTCKKCNAQVKHSAKNMNHLCSKIKQRQNLACCHCTGIGEKRNSNLIYRECEKYLVIEKNGIWYAYRQCPGCQKKLEYVANKKCYVLRNVRNAEIKQQLCISCTMTGDKNHFFGKKHTQAQLDKLIINRTGKGVGVNNAMNNPEHRKKVSVALKTRYASGELDYLREMQRTRIKQTILSGKLKCNIISKPEVEIINTLSSEYNLIVSAQFRIETYRYDIFIEELNLLIEYNGDYWHCNPTKYDANYFNHKKNMYAHQLWSYDYNKTLIAKNNNYNIETIWESDYKNDKTNTIKNILKKYGK